MGPLVFVGIGLGILLFTRDRSQAHVSGQAPPPPLPPQYAPTYTEGPVPIPGERLEAPFVMSPAAPRPIGPTSHVSAVDLDHAPPGWLETWKRTHRPAPPPPRPTPPPPGATPGRPEHPHHHHLHLHLPNLPEGLQSAAHLAIQSGMPHVAAQIAEGAMRGDPIQTIAQTIAPHLNVTASVQATPPGPPDASASGLLDVIAAAMHKQQAQQAADHKTIADQQTSPGWGLQPGQHAPTGNWGAEYENAMLRTETQWTPATGSPTPQYR